MFNHPVLPQEYISIYQKVSLPSTTTVADIIDGFEKIKLDYPEASPDEVELIDDGSNWESDCSFELALVLSRSVDNPNYHTEMERYHSDLAVYHKDQYEWQLLHDKSLQAIIAKKEYKEQSRQARLTKYKDVPVTGAKSCQ